MDAIHPDDLERVCTERQSAIQRGQPYEICLRVRHADGSYRWVLGRTVPLKNLDGPIREWVGMMMDVHDRRSAEERLRISEERLRAAFQAGRAIAWEYDLDGQVVVRSDNAMEILGIGSTPVQDFFDRVHPEDRVRVRLAHRKAIEDGAPCDVEFRFIRPDGRMIWLAAKGSVLRNLSTIPDRFVGITFDITVQKEAEHSGSDASFRGGSRDPLAPEHGSARDRPTGPSVTFQPTRLVTQNGCEEAGLVQVEDCLAAVLVRLDDEPESRWFLETGFGPWSREGLIFPTLHEAEQWAHAQRPSGWAPD
jgi:PAS domain S-box-containing protein